MTQVLWLIKISGAVWGDGSIYEMLGSSRACTLTLAHKHAPRYMRTHMRTTYTQAYTHIHSHRCININTHIHSY